MNNAFSAARSRAVKFVRLTALVASALIGAESAIAESPYDAFNVLPFVGEKQPAPIATGEHDIYHLLYSAVPAEQATGAPINLRTGARQVNYQNSPSGLMPPGTQPALENVNDAFSGLDRKLEKDPCAALTDKPLGQLGIGIAPTAGKVPDDFATACWGQLNTTGTHSIARCWPQSVFTWNATCLCYRPLYFEEINLERYGYGCCECLQPAASAAHFFGTIPALPYCMAQHCPCECNYALGNYRPGSCPPWRRTCATCDPVAAATEGGVMTGLIILFP